jgi:uncharacterized protein YegP (UPF0339 family)
MKIHIFRNPQTKEFFAHIRGRNGRIIWTTGDGYKQRAGVTKAIKLVDPFTLFKIVDHTTDPDEYYQDEIMFPNWRGADRNSGDVRGGAAWVYMAQSTE